MYEQVQYKLQMSVLILIYDARGVFSFDKGRHLISICLVLIHYINMINKNIYLIAAILLFVPLVVIFFQNATMGYVMAFMFNIAASVTSSFWPIVIMSGLMGASITLYIQ
jgi:uncharacterized integral membrane protein